MLKAKVLTFNPLEENCIVLIDSMLQAAIVDPGCYREAEFEALCALVSAENLRPVSVLLTHAHPDHVWGAAKVARKWDLPIYMNPADEPLLDPANSFSLGGLPRFESKFSYLPLKGGDVLQVGRSSLEVIATPGHTPGSVCFYSAPDKLLLSGDTLFAGTIGRTDLPLGSYGDLIRSVMDTLMGLDGDVTVLPGHGGPTDIGYERTHNPFLVPWGNPEDEAFGNGLFVG